MVPQRLRTALKNKKNKIFLISSHVHLEGDALGSELAAASLLRALGKKVFVVNEDRAPAEYSFLPHLKDIHRGGRVPDYDAALLVDCSDIGRIGKVAKMLRKDRLLVNIDHHISNSSFGDVNWVEPSASSASEMIFELFKALRVKIRRDDALLLYTGILSDTGSFRYATTSSRTHAIAAELLKHRLDVYGIYRRLHEDLSFDMVKTLGNVIGTLSTDSSGKVAWLVVNSILVAKDPSLAEQTDDIIRFARSVKGVEVALLFKEIRRNGEVRVNLRSRGRVDVNQIARIFGGGGHKMASGCTLKGRLKDIVRRVVNEAARRCL